MTGHPEFGLPFGQDRLVPTFLATFAVKQKSRTIRFRTAAEMLETLGMRKGGKQYRRLVAAFEPGTTDRRISDALSPEFENVVVLSEEFYEQVIAHPIPTDLDAASALAAAPAVLDLFMWLSHRCLKATG